MDSMDGDSRQNVYRTNFVAMTNSPSHTQSQATEHAYDHLYAADSPKIIPVLPGGINSAYDEFKLTPASGANVLHPIAPTHSGILTYTGYSHTSAPTISQTVSSYSVVGSLMTFVEHEKKHKTSIYGPENRTKFLIVIGIMTFCGGNNDFIGKLCYQSLPDNTYAWYWIAWLLSFATFVICAIGLVFGWNKGIEWNKFKRQKAHFLFNVFMAGSCDVVINLGRYVGLVFLPASVVTVLKCGLQLLFSAVFRILFEGKTLSMTQILGILLVTLGLGLVCLCSFLDTTDSDNAEILIGIGMIVIVGLFGSIRNSFEQILCRDDGYNSNFIVGTRSLASLVGVCLLAVLMLSLPLYDEHRNGWNEMSIDGGLKYLAQYPLFIVCLVLFLLAIYGKNVSQMKVIELSSALTRNLTMQFTPVFTWIFSLFVYYAISHSLGEPWTSYSYIRLIGFIVVLIGSYLYMRIPGA